MLSKRIRLILLKASVLLAVSIFTAASAGCLANQPAYAAQYGYVTAEPVNMRSGMSTDESLVTIVPQGVELDIQSISTDQSWAYVDWNGDQGYVLTMFLSLEEVPDTDSSQSPAEEVSYEDYSSGGDTGQSVQADGYHMLVNQGADIREDAQYGAPSLYSVGSGTDLLVIDRSGEYFKVYYNGEYGYIHEEYVSDYGTVSAPVKASSPSAVPYGIVASDHDKGGSLRSDGYHMLTNTTANVRTGPAQSYGAHFLLAIDQDVLIVDKSGEYYQVYVNGVYGYIHEDYLLDYGAVSATESGSDDVYYESSSSNEGGSLRSDGYHMYLSEAAAVRETPQFGATALDNLPSGSDLLIIDLAGEYYKVYLKGGYGYVHGDYLADYSSASSGSGSSPASAISEPAQSDWGYTAASTGKSTQSVVPSELVTIDAMSSYGDSDIAVSGYVDATAISRVKVYLNGYLLDDANVGGKTFSYTIPSNVTLPGTNVLRVAVSSSEGTLYQEETFTVSKTPLVVLDTGHGGVDPGALGIFNGEVIQEKDYNFEIMEYMKGYLEGYGFQVVLTRDGDYYVANSTRADVANANNADLMFSLHHNASVPSAQGGLSIYPSVKYDPSSQASFAESQDLAARLEDAYLKAGMTYRGAYRDIDISGHTLYVMRNVESRSVLTEMGFITNSEDAAMITDPSFQRLLAKYMADEIYDYFFNR